MELSKKFDKILAIFTVITVILLIGVVFTAFSRNTFAEGEESGTFLTEGARFVTFYDQNTKLTVKTDAKTVRESLERANIILNEGDIVEPSLDSEISADNFFVNIYRAHPVVIKVGAIEKYLMTASYDEKTIMKEAGITIYDGDKISFSPNTHFLEAGVANVYSVTRNGGRTITEEEEIPFEEETIKDYDLDPEVSEVRQYGEVGVKKISYDVLYVDGVEVSREKISEEVIKEPVNRIVAVGATKIEQNPLTPGKGRNSYTTTKDDGSTVLRQETFYDLDMSRVIHNCGSSYSVRSDGVKVDQDGYVLVAANLSYYPRCSVVETSLGAGKVYDTGGFAVGNPEQFDLATDWTDNNGI